MALFPYDAYNRYQRQRKALTGVSPTASQEQGALQAYFTAKEAEDIRRESLGLEREKMKTQEEQFSQSLALQQQIAGQNARSQQQQIALAERANKQQMYSGIAQMALYSPMMYESYKKLGIIPQEGITGAISDAMATKSPVTTTVSPYTETYVPPSDTTALSAYPTSTQPTGMYDVGVPGAEVGVSGTEGAAMGLGYEGSTSALSTGGYATEGAALTQEMGGAGALGGAEGGTAAMGGASTALGVAGAAGAAYGSYQAGQSGGETGGIIGGATLGVMAGASFGPVGMVVGGIVGAAIGYISGSK